MTVKRRPAKRPARRTVSVAIKDGDFAGWTAEARADFPAGVLAQLQSGAIGDVLKALDRIVIEHNFPDEHDEIAATMAEVDPYDGLLVVAGEIFDALGKLPNR